MAPNFVDQICYTHDKPSSWVRIDLGNYRVAPEVYTMAHRAGTPQSQVLQKNSLGVVVVCVFVCVRARFTGCGTDCVPHCHDSEV